MTISYSNKAAYLTVALGKFIQEKPCFVPDNWNGITFVNEWIHITVGRDNDGNEYINANAWGVQFTLSAAPLTSYKFSPKLQSRQWVYSLDEVPRELNRGKIFPAIFRYGGFLVWCGLDYNSRPFACIQMPDKKATLLFRKPSSRSLRPWSPAGAIEIKNGMLCQHVKSISLLKKSGIFCESSGDESVDKLFAKLD